MGVSGNDVGTVEGNPQGHLYGASAPSTTWALRWSSLTAFATPMSHDSDVSGVELIGYVVRGSPD